LFVLLLLVAVSVTEAQKTKKKKKKKPPSVKAPIGLNPGEVAVQAPRWKNVFDMKAGKYWRAVKSPGYPEFTGTQMQASWILEAPIGWRVKVAFRDLNITPRDGDSCRSVYVDLIDPKAGKSQGRSCGTESPGDYVSLGSVMRVDLMSDITKGKYRGFLIMYIISKEKPGRHVSRSYPARKAPAPEASLTGKVNFQSFKSTQQKKPPQPEYPKNLRLIYLSDQIEAANNAVESIVPVDGSEPVNQGTDYSWNDDYPIDPQPQDDAPARPMQVWKPTPITREEVLEPIPDPDDYVEPAEPDYYSNYVQPRNRLNLPIVEYNADDEDDGAWKFTTLHLVIVSAAFCVCIMIISAAFLIKRFYVDGKKKYNKNSRPGGDGEYSMESFDQEKYNRDVYLERPANARQMVELPGLDPGFMRKSASAPPEEESIPPPTPQAHQRYKNSGSHRSPPPYSSRDMNDSSSINRNGYAAKGSTRHNPKFRNLPQQPPMFYGSGNQQQQQRHNPSRGSSSKRRTTSAMHGRPLPPPPPKTVVDAAATLSPAAAAVRARPPAESHYADGDGIVTMKHEYSTWELKRKGPISLCEDWDRPRACV